MHACKPQLWGRWNPFDPHTQQITLGVARFKNISQGRVDHRRFNA